jgi:hypothetical protein
LLPLSANVLAQFFVNANATDRSAQGRGGPGIGRKRAVPMVAVLAVLVPENFGRRELSMVALPAVLPSRNVEPLPKKGNKDGVMKKVGMGETSSPMIGVCVRNSSGATETHLSIFIDFAATL